MLFKKNTVTGTVRSFNRGADRELIIVLRVASGLDRSVTVYGDLASRLELVIFNRRTAGRLPITLTLVFDPDTAEGIDFSFAS